MIKRIILLAACCWVLQAAPVFTLPAGGIFMAPAGTLLNIGFTASSDAQAYVVVQSVDGAVTGIGVLTDLLSNYVAAQLYAYAPGAPDWTENVTPGRPLGPVPGALATLFIPANISVGSYAGLLTINFELFDMDPFVASNFVGLGTGFVTLPFQLNVVGAAEIPEPGLILPVSLGLLYLWRRRQ